jgi:epoxyqueuosine reductase
MSLHEDIQAEAKILGFSLAGITRPERPAHYFTFKNWLKLGRHGTMTYLSDPERVERRFDPQSVMPEARSVISLSMLYSSPLHFPDDAQAAEIRGRVAAYAWGDDYHMIIPSRLDQLAERISKLVGQPILQRRYTDTGPILERDLAQRAGLGWIGKNTCLISSRTGSFFFLAELFVNTDLEPDTPFAFDRCGSCQLCIQACPTRCIQPDRTIDATRCISYLTIENKGAIPADLRPQMGNWIFGCDICQEVCPWNIRFALASGEPAFSSRPGLPRPNLRQELGLSPQEFNLKFKHNPILRAHRRGYLRNVCVALGNQPDPDSVPILVETLSTEPESLVRGHAAWALGRTGISSARSSLERALSSESDPFVQAEIEQAIKTS